MQMKILTPLDCSARNASMVDCGTTCVVKLVNVPSISKNAALMSIAVMENTFRICNFVIARLSQCRERT